MKKDGINIIGYIEQKFSDSQPISYSNESGFKLLFSEENEIRMGLWASNLTVYKHEKNVSNKLLTKYFLATLPRNYEPFSYSGKYCLIPTCPVLDNSSLILVDTESLIKKELKWNGALLSIQFAPSSESVLILGNTNFFLLDCVKNVSTEIQIPYQPNEVEHAYWIDSITIRIMVSSKTDRIQRILNYNTNNKEYETFEIISPGEVFGFEPLEEIIKSDNFCLFNSKGFSKAVVGKLLNQWVLVDFDLESEIYKLRTYVPVSGFFFSKNWNMRGIKTVQQDVEFNFNNIGISGKENAFEKIGYNAIENVILKEN